MRGTKTIFKGEVLLQLPRILSIELIVVEAEVTLLDLTIVSNRAELSDEDIAEVVARAVSAPLVKNQLAVGVILEILGLVTLLDDGTKLQRVAALNL